MGTVRSSAIHSREVPFSRLLAQCACMHRARIDFIRSFGESELETRKHHHDVRMLMMVH